MLGSKIFCSGKNTAARFITAQKDMPFLPPLR